VTDCNGNPFFVRGWREGKKRLQWKAGPELRGDARILILHAETLRRKNKLTIDNVQCTMDNKFLPAVVFHRPVNENQNTKTWG
jgi:hypothetical protein